MSVLLKRDGVSLLPVFIDYGQRARKREWIVCQSIHRRYGLPKPRRVSLEGLGRAVTCGLTNAKMDIFADAFLPGRNLYFLLVGASLAVQHNADAIAIGLLSERARLFPDQSAKFIRSTEGLLSIAMGRKIRVLAPLMDLRKRDVVKIANSLRLEGTYSCHAGGVRPCGKCIACREYT
jgi:7-cyano-7-deazaguanine synthase